MIFIGLSSILIAQENYQIPEKVDFEKIIINENCYCVGKIVNQQKVGIWLYYSIKHNDIYQIAHFESDTLNGHVYCLRADGTIRMDLYYKDGYLNGWSFFYNSNGELVAKIFYNNSIGLHWDKIIDDIDGPSLKRSFVPSCDCLN